jgi:monothiol glutaredoxin
VKNVNEALQKRIEDMINAKKVFLFMKGTPDNPQCGFSMQVAQVLQATGVDFGSFDVLSDESIRQGIKDFANWPTIPQLYVGGKFIGGCDIITQMQQSGELQKVLEA